MNKAELKEAVCKAIDARYADIEKVAMDIFAEPELGFKEKKTSAKVKAVFDSLGMNYTDGWGITGVKARMQGRNSRRTVALLGELDAIICRDHPNCDPVTGAAHCCGHNVQIANLVAVAMAFKDAGIMKELDGDVVFFAVPAELKLITATAFVKKVNCVIWAAKRKSLPRAVLTTSTCPCKCTWIRRTIPMANSKWAPAAMALSVN